MNSRKYLFTAFVVISFLVFLSAEKTIKINDVQIGTLSGQAQLLSMHRNYEGVGNGASSTLGGVLDFSSVRVRNVGFKLSYVHVEVLGTSGGRFGTQQGENLLYNGKVNVFNEAAVDFFCPKTKSSFKVGRQVVNGEIFRANPFRQKKRSLEAAVFSLGSIKNLNISIGHANRMSNVWDHRDHNWLTWKFKDLSFAALGKQGGNLAYDTDGFHWIEGVYGTRNFEIATYYGRASEIADVRGLRSRVSMKSGYDLLTYFRSEESIDQLDTDAPYRSMMYGLSVAKTYGIYSLESGFLGISGDGLLFEELNTGINHALGSSLMIYPGIFNGGAKSAYMRAVIKKPNQRLYYFLYTYTWHEASKSAINTAQEVDFVFKHPWNAVFSFNLKGGYGIRDNFNGSKTDAVDLRFFLTHKF